MFKLTSFVVTVLLATSAFADPMKFTCGNNPTGDDLLAMAEKFVVNNTASPLKRAANAATIQVAWHVIAQDNTPQGGNIPDGLIQQQIKVLNEDSARARTGLSFQLVGIDRTVNPAWAGGAVGDGTKEEYQMKSTLRKGNIATLNVYSVITIAGAPPGYLLDGYSTFPWDFNKAPWKDGIVLATYSLPGGPIPARGYGRTLTHEVGHWVGLLHPFQNGCTAPGDYVDDTPFQASAGSGCPQGRDTCPQPGVDAITNYMDYTDDLCRTGLTQGQIVRATQALRQFRGI